jgi:hypothetical protein
MSFLPLLTSSALPQESGMKAKEWWHLKFAVNQGTDVIAMIKVKGLSKKIISWGECQDRKISYYQHEDKQT